jgi:hypothetical protein
MSAPANCRLIRRWRIVEAGFWDRDHLHLSGPAIITITNHGRAKSPSARSKPVSTLNTAGLRSGFTLEGFESDDGSAEPLNDGSIGIEFVYHDGDETVLKAKPGTSSNPAKC